MKPLTSIKAAVTIVSCRTYLGLSVSTHWHCRKDMAWCI